MSFKTVEPAPARVNRTELAVPGSQPRFFERAARSAADVVFLDLEDSVAPDDKDKARRDVIQAVGDIDWGEKTLSVRINGLDTHYMYRDVVDVMEQSSERLDLIMIPKVGTASDLYALDLLVTQIEAAKRRRKRVGFEALIETALGMANVDAIAAASPRLESLHFGPGDYAASTKARSTQIGGSNPDYAVLTDAGAGGKRERHWGDMWHYALSRIVVAARANGLRPLDGPFGDIADGAGLDQAAARSASLGCEGKWVIHPSQIERVNQAFTPSEAEITRARRILEAMQAAERDGKGAVQLDGRLIDIASIRQARMMVAKADMILKRRSAGAG